MNYAYDITLFVIIIYKTIISITDERIKFPNCTITRKVDVRTSETVVYV